MNSTSGSSPPSRYRRVAHNVFWNWMGMGVNVIAGFVVAPFLIRTLGDTGYGLWILIASLVYYFGLLDMGIRGAVGRQIALHCAQKDHEGLNATLNTALLLLLGAGLMAMLGTLLALLGFFHLFEVPADRVPEVRIALLLVGAGLTIWLPLSVFEAVLWAYQRFDIINAADIAAALVRLGLIFYLLNTGGGLIALAAIQVGCQAGAICIKCISVFRLDRHLRLSPRFIRRDAGRAVLGIGFWNTLISGSMVVNGQMGPVIIGSGLGVSLVTPYNIAARLAAYGRDFLVASTGVLTPVAVALHAGDDRGAERRLFFKGGKYCLAISLYFLTLYLFLGHSLISLWIGPKMAWAAGLLVIIALGEALPMSQWVSYSIILGKYRHRVLGIAGVIENILSIVLALILVRPYGLIGVCLGFAIPATLVRGVFQFLYALRLVRASLGRYLFQVLLPMVGTAVLPALALAAMVQWQEPNRWPLLVAYGAVYSLLYVGMLAAMTGYEWLRSRPRSLRATVDEPRLSLARRVAIVLQETW